jgi:hypothetical protein
MIVFPATVIDNPNFIINGASIGAIGPAAPSSWGVYFGNKTGDVNTDEIGDWPLAIDWVAIGSHAGGAGTLNNEWSAFGAYALYGAAMTDAGAATAVGAYAGNDVTGSVAASVMVGYSASYQNSGFTDSVAVGYYAASSNAVAIARSVFVGFESGHLPAAGITDAACLGYQAGYNISANGVLGTGHIAIGYRAGRAYNGDKNICIGWEAALTGGTGDNNILIGDSTLIAGAGTGSDNVIIGAGATVPDNTTGAVVIGAGRGGAVASGEILIGSSTEDRIAVDANGVADFIDNNGASAFKAMPSNSNGGAAYGSAACAFADLPAVPADGYRACINDSTLAYIGANIGAPAVGGAAFTSPVVRIGGAWVIG